MPLSSCSARILEIRKCRASERAENSLAQGDAVRWHQNNGRSADDRSADSGDTAETEGAFAGR